MDARERAGKIAEAGYEVFADQMFPGYRRWYALESTEKEKFTKAIAAAVRAAYEIDGVGNLVELALDAAASLDAEIGPRYEFADGHVHPSQQRAYERDKEEVETLRAAAARVREAMGGGA